MLIDRPLCRSEQHPVTRSNAQKKRVCFFRCLSFHIIFDNFVVTVASLMLICCITNRRWACWTHPIWLSLETAYCEAQSEPCGMWLMSLTFIAFPFNDVNSLTNNQNSFSPLSFKKAMQQLRDIYNTLHAIIYRMWLSISSIYEI